MTEEQVQAFIRDLNEVLNRHDMHIETTKSGSCVAPGCVLYALLPNESASLGQFRLVRCLKQ